MGKYLLGLILPLILLGSNVFAQDPQPALTSLSLGQLMTVSEAMAGYTYYMVNFEVKSDSTSLLLVTVQTEQHDSISIYTSIYYEGVDEYFKYPNYENNTNSCSY